MAKGGATRHEVNRCPVSDGGAAHGNAVMVTTS